MKFQLIVKTPGDKVGKVLNTATASSVEEMAKMADYIAQCRDRWRDSGLFPAGSAFDTRVF